MPGSFQNDDPQRDPGPDEHGGSVKESARRFHHEIGEHLKARSELFALEVREVGALVARKGISAIAAIVLLFFAYVLFLAAGVSLLGQALEALWPALGAGRGWQFAAIAAALLHLLLAFLLFTRLKRKPAQPFFEYTRAEFRKDRQWLQKNHSRKKSGDSH